MFKRSRKKITVVVMTSLICIYVVMLLIIYITTFREISNENRDLLERYAGLYEEYGTPESSDAPNDDGGGNAGAEGGADADAGDGADADAGDGTGADTGDGADADAGDGTGADTGGNADADAGAGTSTPSERGDTGRPSDEESFEIELDDDTEESIDNRRFSVATFYSVAFDEDGNAQEITNDSVPDLSEDEIAEFASELLKEGKVYGTRDNVVYLITEADDYTLVTMMDNTILGESISSLLRYTLLFGVIFLAAAFFLSRSLSKWIIRPLETAYQKQSRFISDAGHELKTPIATVSANAELLSREIGESAWLANIRYENERMSELVSRLLNLAELEKGQPLHEPVDFSHLVLEGILPFEGIAFERGIRMEYEIAEEISVTGDAMTLGELVSVLVDNAVEHTEADGLIRISLTSSHTQAVLAVENQGPEIPEEQREKIFERFYRTDEARSGETAHYGLGLSIAQAAAEAHNGKITVSCADGFTKFEVTLDLQ